MQESLRRGYLTIELYAARKLKSPYIIGATRIPLSTLFTQSSLTGTINLGEREKGAGLWEMSYSITIRRPQNKDVSVCLSVCLFVCLFVISVSGE